MGVDSSLSKSVMDIVGFLLISAAYILQAVFRACLPRKWQQFKDISGEIALVTGGGGGLGRLLALRLAKLGATVVLWDINVQGLEETVNLVKGIGGTAYAFKCDIADKDDVYRAADITRKEVGDVTILINNAGVVSGNLLLNTPDHLIKRTFDVNIIAHFWTVKAFLPKMIETDHGHIITVASMAGFVGTYKLVDYCSSKYAAVGFDEALRVELEAQGIYGVKTSVVCPYFIQSTGMFNDVNTRFLPTLKPNDVADRIIEALQKEETVVMMPNVFRIGLILRLIVPWSVVSMFMRGLVLDPTPHHNPKIKEKTENGNIPSIPNGNIEETIDGCKSKIEKIDDVPKNTVKHAVASIQHRNVNGKNLH